MDLFCDLCCCFTKERNMNFILMTLYNLIIQKINKHVHCDFYESWGSSPWRNYTLNFMGWVCKLRGSMKLPCTFLIWHPFSYQSMIYIFFHHIPDNIARSNSNVIFCIVFFDFTNLMWMTHYLNPHWHFGCISHSTSDIMTHT